MTHRCHPPLRLPPRIPYPEGGGAPINPIEPGIEGDLDADGTDRAALMAFYEEAMRKPPSLPLADIVEFRHVLEIRFGGNNRAARCCRSRRGIRCPFCHPEDYR